jgi:type III pantothenate kinase
VTVLLVDIGNTRIKWAKLARGRLGRQHAAAHLGWHVHRFRREVFQRSSELQRIVVASVAGPNVDRTFAAAARGASGIAPEFIAPVRRAGGVVTRYAEPWRLGVDRFVAVIGAHALSGNVPACVVDVGTAMTIDLVDSRGVHRGGAIVPGPALMESSLLRETSGIRRRARGGGRARSLFARNTLSAIQLGARHAVAAAIDRAVAEARRELRTPPRVFLTGGDAPAIRPLLRSRHLLVPDLVLRGLAVLVGEHLP